MKDKIRLEFEKWLKEDATTTGDIASFAMPVFSRPFERNRIDPILTEKKKKKKNKK
jgi:hypothetical protein